MMQRLNWFGQDRVCEGGTYMQLIAWFTNGFLPFGAESCQQAAVLSEGKEKCTCRADSPHPPLTNAAKLAELR
jgi:hypothetical protein